MTVQGRVTLTAKQASSPNGAQLIERILKISHDGDLSIAEVKDLHEFLKYAPDEVNAIRFLREITTTIIADGSIDPCEAYELRRAMERVVPKSVRSDLTSLLSRIGLPSDFEEDDEPTPRRQQPWRSDPATEAQIDFILDLGGVADERMTKGDACDLINDLKNRRLPSARQMMVMRFFDREDLMSKTKQEVSAWMDELYRRNEEFERAWDLFKLDIGDDGSLKDPMMVPVGAYRKYIRDRRPRPNAPRVQPRARPWKVAVVVVVGLVMLLFGMIWWTTRTR